MGTHPGQRGLVSSQLCQSEEFGIHFLFDSTIVSCLHQNDIFQILINGGTIQRMLFRPETLGAQLVGFQCTLKMHIADRMLMLDLKVTSRIKSIKMLTECKSDLI